MKNSIRESWVEETIRKVYITYCAEREWKDLQARDLQALTEDEVAYGIKNEADVVCVDRAGNLPVNLITSDFAVGMDSVQEHSVNELDGSVEVFATLVLFVGFLDRDALNLLSEKILLVEEENDGQVGSKVLRVDSLIPDIQGLLHLCFLRLIFGHDVIFVEGNEEDESIHSLLGMDPLSPLHLLTTNINNSPCVLLNLNRRARLCPDVSLGPRITFWRGNKHTLNCVSTMPVVR
jgi:hypothetical protein